MSDDVTCDNCGAHGRRKLRRVAPFGWLWLEAKDSERLGADDSLIIYACSKRCADALWKPGPGFLNLETNECEVSDAHSVSIAEAPPPAACPHCNGARFIDSPRGLIACPGCEPPPAPPEGEPVCPTCKEPRDLDPCVCSNAFHILPPAGSPTEPQPVASDEELVHYSHHASQPYVRFACTDADHYVSGDKGSPLKDVHRSDGGLYSFDREPVTCEACRARMEREGWTPRPGEYDPNVAEKQAKVAWDKFKRFRPKLADDEFLFTIGYLRGGQAAHAAGLAAGRATPEAREGEPSDDELRDIHLKAATSGPSPKHFNGRIGLRAIFNAGRDLASQKLREVEAERDEARTGYHQMDRNWKTVHDAAMGPIRAAIGNPGETVPEIVKRIAQLSAAESRAAEAERERDEARTQWADASVIFKEALDKVASLQSQLAEARAVVEAATIRLDEAYQLLSWAQALFGRAINEPFSIQWERAHSDWDEKATKFGMVPLREAPIQESTQALDALSASTSGER